MGLLLWGRTEGNPGITSYSILAMGLTVYLLALRLKNNFVTLLWSVAGRTQQQSPTAASPER